MATTPARPTHPHPIPRSVEFRLEIGSISARPTRRRGTHDELGDKGHMPQFETVGEQQIGDSATDLEAEYDRSRRGTGPISVRVTTDLDAEYDRSRR